ncbi:MAG: cytochrome c [Chloroflexi bacterium]|nr:cytochrome c [Chloroflexota bacterium]
MSQLSHHPRIHLLRLSQLAIAATALVITVSACSDGTKYPIKLTDSLVDDGRVVYGANCAVCHGDSTVRPPLPDAPTHAADGHTWHHQDRLLVEWVLYGVPMGGLMPNFVGTLSENEVRAAIAYIKTFWPDPIIEQQTRGSAEYEKQLGH